VTKTWSMDAEPGPDVTRVRDRFGILWRHDVLDLWLGHIGHTDENGQPYEDYRQWHELLRRGPLTDASNE